MSDEKFIKLLDFLEHVMNHAADSIEFKQQVLAELDVLKTQGEELYMALSTAEQNILDRFNVATTAISNKIDALIANSPNLDDAEFNAQLQAIADGLDLLGQPGQPLPPAVPVP